MTGLLAAPALLAEAPKWPILFPAAGVVLCVVALVSRSLEPVSRWMIMGGWTLFAVCSPTAQFPEFLRIVAIGVFGVGALLHAYAHAADPRPRHHVVALSSRLLLIYVVFVLLGCIASPYGPVNLIRGVQGAVIIAVAFYAVSIRFTDRLLAGTFLAAVVNVVLTVVSNRPELDTMHKPTGRLAGYMQPNHLAFACAEVMIGVMWAWSRRNRATLPLLGNVSLRGPFFISFVLAAYALYASESRTALIGVVVAMGLGWFASVQVPGLRLKVVVFGTMALVVLGPILAPAVGTYLNRDKSSESITSLTGRTDFWPFAVELIQQRPVIGWGVDVVSSPVGSKFQKVLPGVSQAHNAYLEAGLQSGLIGAIAWGLSLLSVVIGSFTLPHRSEYKMLVIAASVLTFVFAFTESSPAWFGDMFLVYVVCAALYSEEIQLRIPRHRPSRILVAS